MTDAHSGTTETMAVLLASSRFSCGLLHIVRVVPCDASLIKSPTVKVTKFVDDAALNSSGSVEWLRTLAPRVAESLLHALEEMERERGRGEEGGVSAWTRPVGKATPSLLSPLSPLLPLSFSQNEQKNSTTHRKGEERQHHKRRMGDEEKQHHIERKAPGITFLFWGRGGPFPLVLMLPLLLGVGLAFLPWVKVAFFSASFLALELPLPLIPS